MALKPPQVASNSTLHFPIIISVSHHSLVWSCWLIYKMSYS